MVSDYGVCVRSYLMQSPDSFPFDVLDPDPGYCGSCSCNLAEEQVQPDCRYPTCHCHREWLTDTSELGDGLRYLWGDR